MRPLIHILEDDPLFNAGRGAVFTADGKNELDSAIMDGATLKAGAVAGVTRTRHPISLARAVMDKSPHVMLVGAGAEQFAASAGLEQVDPSFFFTERRWQALVKQLKKDGLPIPPRPAGAPPRLQQPVSRDRAPDAHKYGTVGVVALDRHGNIAAGTSTGGTAGQALGPRRRLAHHRRGHLCLQPVVRRLGTGTGEYFIRLTVAREVCATGAVQGHEAAGRRRHVIHKELQDLQGDGGIIAIAPDGQMAWSFNTPGMYRARLAEGGKIQIGIYNDEP